MKVLFSVPIRPYMFTVLLTFITMGVILFQAADEPIIIIAVLFFGFIIIQIIVFLLYTNYVKPVQKATYTIDEFIKGNFNARFHNSSNEAIEELSYKINTLARNMSAISMQEQMQSEQLSTLIDSIQSGLVLIDEKGFIHVVNRKFITMFGKTEKEYRGHLYYEVLENETIHETVQKTFLYERNIKETFTQTHGVDKSYFEIVGAPMFNERNLLKGAVLVLHDITELKKMEKTRKDFVANVSHELRTPITSIKGFTETLLDSGENKDETTKEFLGIIYHESHRLQLLIEDLLSLSRLEKDGFRLVLHTFKAKDLIEEVIPALKHKAMEKKLQLLINVDEETEMKADKERIKQVIVNLLDNAIHYTPENGKVELSLDSTADFIHIKIADTGIGIDEKSIPRIFERFYRIDKARSRNTGGTGLGLAIVKHIVEVHDGKIEVESEVNQGTIIHVYLPK